MGICLKVFFNTFLIVSGEMRQNVKLLQSSTTNYSIVDAFLWNNNSTIRRISPEKMRIVLKNNLNKCPRISPKKGQKRPKNLHTQMSENSLFLLPIF